MSARPKAPGENPEPWWTVVGAWLILVAVICLFGVLLSVPHPLTVLAVTVWS